MDILITIVCATVVIGFIVLIHEGGHYLAARAFGVRVSEFMLGLPGPSIGFTRGGTRFGITAVPLGGYARICGMEAGEMSPHLKSALAALYERGTTTIGEVAAACGISDDEAFEALEELVEWGSAVGPAKGDPEDVYRAAATTAPKACRARLARAKRRTVPIAAPEVGATLQASAGAAVHAEPGAAAASAYALGEPRSVADPDALFAAEYSQQYRALPFWKRSVILLAGVAVNLLFAVLAFIVIYSVIGVDLQNTETGEVFHFNATPLQSIQAGFMYIVAVVQAVAGLFNPATAADTVSQSSSIVGIAVMSRDFFEAGFVYALEFTAMISVSVGIMNLIPIPPLDGGRFVVEIIQKIRRKSVSAKALGYASWVGMGLFLVFFAIMVNQDIQRFIFGNWG
mgnify:CR=1 FL=1